MFLSKLATQCELQYDVRQVVRQKECLEVSDKVIYPITPGPSQSLHMLDLRIQSSGTGPLAVLLNGHMLHVLDSRIWSSDTSPLAGLLNGHVQALGWTWSGGVYYLIGHFQTLFILPLVIHCIVVHIA